MKDLICLLATVRTLKAAMKMCIIRVGQITPLISKRLVSMAKFDVEHESVKRFYI